jgi:hypothetical protein
LLNFSKKYNKNNAAVNAINASNASALGSDNSGNIIDVVRGASTPSLLV